MHNQDEASGSPDPDLTEIDQRFSVVGDAPSPNNADADTTPVIGGIDYGNWWHGVLQHYPWNESRPAARTHYLEEQCDKLDGVVEWTERARVELSLFAASTTHAEFLARGEVFLAEMPFASPRNANEWLEGIMDLVIVTRQGETWIVDWKTDRRWSTDVGDQAFLRHLSDKYRPQLEAYAEVFAQGLGRPISRLLLYSTVLGQVQEVT